MISRRALVAPLLCTFLAALSSYACDDGTTTQLGPSTARIETVHTGAFVSSLDSIPNDDITAVAVPAAFCPFVSPFLAPVNVVLRADAGRDLFLHDMSLQFIDTAGVHGAFRSINGAEVTSLFGSTRIPAFGTRTFPVSLPFGCVGGQTGTLFIQAVTLDASGRQDLTSMRVNVH